MKTRLSIALVALGLGFPALAKEEAPVPAGASAARDLAFGAYQRGDYKAAMSEAKKRVDANPKDAAALTLIGRLYLEGAGVKRDVKHAMDWYRRGADAGAAEAAYH
jgi:uncharacterized protein